MEKSVENYLIKLKKKHQTGEARELSYRSALEDLLSDLNEKIEVVNEPARTEAGAPDLILLDDDVPRGYIEAKDVDKDLDKLVDSDQLQRYLNAFDNVVFTNYLDFYFYREGEKYDEVSIGRLEGGEIVLSEESSEQFASLLKDFLSRTPQSIKSADKLAEIMADKAKLLRDKVKGVLGDDDKTTEVHDQFKAFEQVLIKDLDEDGFADMYAQTIVYGLLAARYNDPSLDSFSRQEAHELLPEGNPFLRKFFKHIASTDYDLRLDWIIDDLISAFLASDVHKIMHEEFEKKRRDPMMHFYETFLGEYDKELKQSRGVFYTPRPIVSFITQSVDQILQDKFDLTDGIANTETVEIEEESQGYDRRRKDDKKRVKQEVPKVQILDPATGTGTFLNQIVKDTYKKFEDKKGAWKSYVNEHLTPRLWGFELMMAPYTMAHLNLDMTLSETGVEDVDDRFGIYLTNTLEEPKKEVPNLFMTKWLSRESRQANRVKEDMPIRVVLGNPPYSGISSNKGDWIMELIEDYKYVDGEHFGERKHWLGDDYVKFIRFAEDQIDQTGEGVVAYITNHGYLDNPTFRGMRWHLMSTFDEIYVLDLHGNSNKGEVAPDGSKDENVFDIQQGVAIFLGVKTGEKSDGLADVYHDEIYGEKGNKYEYLSKNSWQELDWKEINPQEKYYFFTNKDMSSRAAYREGVKLDELFTENVSGIVTMGDDFAIADTKNEMRDRITEVKQRRPNEEELREEYDLGKNYPEFLLENLEKFEFDEKKLVPVTYRPFDTRWTYFDNDILWRWRRSVMRHMVNKENMGLALTKRDRQKSLGYVFITDKLLDFHVLDTAGDSTSIFPLYTYPEEDSLFGEGEGKRPNFDTDMIERIESQTSLEFVMDPQNEKREKKVLTPESIFDYCYGVLNSPHYREKFKEFLKIDFPRVLFTESEEIFQKIVNKGSQLRELHLMQKIPEISTTFPNDGPMEVTKNKFELNKSSQNTGKVWINENQYFGNVPKDVWGFYIGGYQVVQTYLRYRKRDGKKLTYDDVEHLQKVIAILDKTQDIMDDLSELTKNIYK